MPRFLALIFAYFFLALALIGIVVPGLPTVPFLLLAAWCSAKGSQRLHRWLYQHPQFGQILIDWETQRAVSRKSKWLAVTMMAASFAILVWKIDQILILATVASLFVVVSTYLITRNEPK